MAEAKTTEGWVRTGGCLCGAVRFEARGTPENVRVCHCTLCQKAMSGPFFARALYGIDQVTYSAGTERYPSSPQSWRVFCRECGTRLFAERPGSERIGVSLAAFDDPEGLTPDCHFFTAFSAPWLKLDDGLPQYEEWPPD